MAQTGRPREFTIEPAKVQEILASGGSTTDVRKYYGCNQKTLYYQRERNPDLDAAFIEGFRLRAEREKNKPHLGNDILKLLNEILSEVQVMKSDFQRPGT